jgi:hypothetical protein
MAVYMPSFSFCSYGLHWVGGSQKDPGHNMEWWSKQHEREYLGDALYYRNLLNIEFN